MERTYIAIDLKSYYASVECADRKLNPLTTNLVVADLTRTEKTICLAVSPSLKAYGISGRARLFEVVQKVKEINAQRLTRAAAEHRVQYQNGRAVFSGSSFDSVALEKNPALEVTYLVAPPHMARYEEVSASIYGIYLKYAAPKDILIYSIDEVFIDATDYLPLYHLTAHELTMAIVREVLYTTGITATAGIGTNLYLAKVAMDIVAKHTAPDRDGVRIAELNEKSYRRLLWTHEPITDFWQVGSGYKKKLHEIGLYTMGDIARCSLGKSDEFYNEELLYRRFGIHAEILIDHAWGWEPCTMEDINAYTPEAQSLSTGQVLPEPYSFENGRLIVTEMTDSLALDLMKNSLCTRQLVLSIGYDRESLTRPGIRYSGKTERDHYGRTVPKRSVGTANLPMYTANSTDLIHAALALYDRIAGQNLLIRRINLAANDVKPESDVLYAPQFEQLSLFQEAGEAESRAAADRERQERERTLQHTILNLRAQYGKNYLVKGMNLSTNAREMERNESIGGHKA